MFSKPPINDGRDLFKEVLKADWKVSKKLFEIVQYIPEFVAEAILADNINVYGSFHLGNLYEMSNWGSVNELTGILRSSTVKNKMRGMRIPSIPGNL